MNKHDWLEAVHSVSCVVCGKYGVSAHHIDSVRNELSDYATVALCPECHTGPGGVHTLSRRGFEMRYKLSELDLLKRTIAAVVKEL